MQAAAASGTGSAWIEGLSSLEVAVPATSANLGPGFDCLGVALAVHLTVRFSESDWPEITGKGHVRSIEDTLIYQSFRAACRAAGGKTPGVRIEVVEDYPSGRGLGASASAIVAGLIGAKALAGLSLSESDLARLAVEIEGHPDNVLPALLGGLILSLGDRWVRFTPAETVRPLILVARGTFKTEAARKVLPETISSTDSVANASALAALVSILTGHADLSDLLAATDDRLHEPYRLPLMPETLEIHKSLRERGVATVLSGAGPSLLCLVGSDSLREGVETATAVLPEGWRILQPFWDVRGARLLPA